MATAETEFGTAQSQGTQQAAQGAQQTAQGAQQAGQGFQPPGFQSTPSMTTQGPLQTPTQAAAPTSPQAPRPSSQQISQTPRASQQAPQSSAAAPQSFVTAPQSFAASQPSPAAPPPTSSQQSFEEREHQRLLSQLNKMSTPPKVAQSPADFAQPYEISDADDEYEDDEGGGYLVWFIALLVIAAVVALGWFFFFSAEKVGEEAPPPPVVEEPVDENLIGSEGGQVCDEYGACIVIPEDALDTEIRFEIVRIRTGRVTDLYQLKPEGIRFKRAVKVYIPYHNEKLYASETPFDITLSIGKTQNNVDVKKPTIVMLSQRKVGTEFDRF